MAGKWKSRRYIEAAIRNIDSARCNMDPAELGGSAQYKQASADLLRAERYLREIETRFKK